MPTMIASTTGSIRVIAARLARVKRSPTCAPIRANAAHCSSGRHRRRRRASRAALSTAATASGPSRVAVGNRHEPGEQQPDRPATTTTYARSAAAKPAPGVEAPDAVLGAEDDRGDQRHQQQHDQHPQVLHDGHHPVVGAEVAGHRHHPGGAARDQREGTGHRRDVVGAARATARRPGSSRTVPRMTSRDRQQGRGRSRSRAGRLDQRADDHADQRLGDAEQRGRRHAQHGRRGEGVRHASRAARRRARPRAGAAARAPGPAPRSRPARAPRAARGDRWASDIAASLGRVPTRRRRPGDGPGAPPRVRP